MQSKNRNAEKINCELCNEKTYPPMGSGCINYTNYYCEKCYKALEILKIKNRELWIKKRNKILGDKQWQKK